MRRALSLILIAGLALTGLPALAQDFGPNTIWGEVPAGVSGNAANAILQDAGGRVLASVPVIDGKFAFRDVIPGQYVVVLQDGAGKALATSQGISFASGATTKALFDATRVPAAAVTGGGGKGLGTTGWILIGAAAVGITTAIVIATNNDEGVASPSH
jgi:hypothetical protein